MQYPPTAKELREWCADKGLSRRKCVSLLDVGPQTVSSWRAGHSTIPYSVWVVLRLFAADSPEEIQEVVDDVRAIEL